VRLGAIGDHLVTTPLYRALHEEGHHVTAHTNAMGRTILAGNPHIDAWSRHDEWVPPDETLGRYLAKLAAKYDTMINLCESIEGSLSKVEGRPEFHWPQARRQAECNVNFYDHTMALGGFPDRTGTRPEFYPTKAEREWAKAYRTRFHKQFVILWGLSGSSFHKTYPHTEQVLVEWLAQHPDAVVVTVGDGYCTLLEFDHPQVKKQAAKWTIRESLTMTRYADLVVGTDTGLMHGAGCWDTPKILLTSANTEENLSKYWRQTTTLAAGVPCQPCHRLIYTLTACPINEFWQSPICMAELSPETVKSALETQYLKWRAARSGVLQEVG